MKDEIKKLSLKKGDILVVQKGFNAQPNWEKTLQEVAKTAGVDFSVPVIFVDSIDEIAVVRLGQNV